MPVIACNEGINNFGHYCVLHYTAFRVHLFQNDIALGVETLFSDLIEADFPGYVFGSLQPTANNVDPATALTVVEWPVHNFTHDGNPGSNTIYGWALSFLNLAAGPSYLRLLLADKFESPVVMDELGDVIGVGPILSFHLCPQA